MLAALHYALPQIIYVAVMTAAASLIVLHALKKKSLLDRPNERSMHTQPTPRGGGIAIALVFLLMAMQFGDSLQSTGFMLPIWTLPLSLTILAGVSYWDDYRPLNPLIRLAAHFVAVLMMMFFLPLDFLATDNYLFEFIFLTTLVVALVGFMNIVNFMDGIDGITCAELGSIALGVVLIASITGAAPNTVFLGTVLLGCCIGFLFFNWHPAKMFLGDVGSIPMGFFTGFMLLVAAMEGLWLPALILPLYYIADGGITLLRRLLRGEKVWQAHREHFYQRATMAVGRHDIVVFWVLLTNIALIAISCLAVVFNPWFSLLAPVTVATLLLHMERAASRKLPAKNK
jgi:UDP-N-acetylmuramyl pentapeptide phosphotransferase/UDP-N-acetylglucosamine-1-phosphate transferase